MILNTKLTYTQTHCFVLSFFIVLTPRLYVSFILSFFRDYGHVLTKKVDSRTSVKSKTIVYFFIYLATFGNLL